VIKLFETAAKIIRFVKTLIYVFITMFLLTAILGHSFLSDYIMSIVFAGVVWNVGFLILEYTFAPRVGANGEKLSSRVMSSTTSSAKRKFTAVFLSLWFLAIMTFSLMLLFQLK
jgi:hypothetical protein